MNEKIAKFAEQSGLLGPTSRIGNSHEATERFAELLIEECAEVADKAWNDPGTYPGNLVRKHFGV